MISIPQKRYAEVISERILKILHRVWVVALLAIYLPSTALAAEKNYMVKAPDGVSIAVQETGDPDGPPIVFIHGLLGGVDELVDELIEA
ncbi:hypothetical protein BRY73_24540 [Ochrobactrum sp. P6BS-III]|uniref:hypothetical protein n=1 Tax=unclassified Ochrobactrum TaxID=239106 RepID=UPI000993BAC5|nr:hypothetical protein [Ochrobactrum sp. P6BSIII]OOL13625.1 hypothetical protein BRY73_24540 [Ochrobactrum sp. P6BS-III]